MKNINTPGSIPRLLAACVMGLLLTACQQSDLSNEASVRNSNGVSQEVSPSTYVNPFIGTDGTGHTFPGAAAPFGMVQVSPDTNNHSWDHTSGYQYKDPTIMGFSHNHLSGTGISDFGDILLQPISGEYSRQARSHYDKSTEKASPGFYSVHLTDHHVKVNLTASTRAAFHQYQYATDEPQRVLLDLQHGVVNNWIPLEQHIDDADINFESDRVISGYIESTSWVTHKTFFVIEFDHPIKGKTKLMPKEGEKGGRYILNLGETANRQLQIKVALSGVSVDGAKANLREEIPHWNFNKVVSDTVKQWDQYLSRIAIEAPQQQKEIFYTGLYHLFLQPNITSDTDGRYRGYDDKVHVAKGRSHYSTFSIWDTYRAAHPMYTILVPELVDDFVNSMIAQEELQGFLPIWGLANKETYTMIGNHAIPVLTDAVLKGIPGIDPKAAYKAVKDTATISHKNSDWELYEQYGYYPYDLLDRDGESVSRTLEHTYDDFAAAQLAKFVGEEQDHQHFMTRANYYRNLFDAETGFMRGKDSGGNWRPDFDPIVPTSPMNNPGDYTEANAYQYSWAVQHDTPGMIELFGSKQAFADKLDEFFSTYAEEAEAHLGQEALIGQYAHGNEPSHHIAYLYQFANRSEKTRELVTRIYNEFYTNQPDGIQGNEDCGQMSAWYIFTTLGFYPVDPSIGEYVFGVPQVGAATIYSPDKPPFTVKRNGGVAEVDQVTFNGEPVDDIFVTHQQIQQGGELVFSAR